jgi:ABC-2 type transport system permease protein
VADELAGGTAVLRLAGAVGYIAVSLLIVAALAFLLSVSTDAPLGAVGGAVLLQILSSILDQITALGSLRNVLPTHYANAWLAFLSTPISDGRSGTRLYHVHLLRRGALSASAFWRFLRKDVVS